MDDRQNSDNNNTYWNLDHTLSEDEMKDLGVNILPENLGPIFDNKKRQRDRKNECRVYNKFAAREANEYEETQQCKFLKSEKFLYRPKQTLSNTNKDVFSTLSDEIVLGIFNHFTHEDLKVVAQVCHRFRQLAYDESLWSRIDLAYTSLNSNSLAYIIKRGVKVLRLKETTVHSPVWTKTLDVKMSGLCSKIEYLDMSYCLISSKDLAMFLSKCKSLKKLSLESCVLSVDVCSEISNNHDLNTLNLAMAEGLEQEGLRLICTYCERLESINLSWTNLDKEAVNVFVNSITKELLSLNLSGLQHSLNDNHLATLVSRCPNIIELDISDAFGVTSSSIPLLAECLSNIKSLSFSRCWKINPARVVENMKHFRNLRSLNDFCQAENQEFLDLEKNYNLLRVNKEYFSTISRPTVGLRRTSIWLVRCRE